MNQINPPSLALPTGQRATLQPLPQPQAQGPAMAQDGYARQNVASVGPADVQALRQQLMAVHQDLANLQRELQVMLQSLPAPAPQGPGPAEVVPSGPQVATVPGQPSAQGEVVVAAGDFLWKLAEQHLGDAARWPELYQLNRDAIGDNPNLLQPGQRLRLPGAPAPAAQGPAPAVATPPNPNQAFTPAAPGWPNQGPLPGLPGGPAWQPQGPQAPAPFPAPAGDPFAAAQQAVGNIGLPPVPSLPGAALPNVPPPGLPPAGLPQSPAPYPVVPNPAPQGQWPPAPQPQAPVPTGPAYAPGAFPAQSAPAVRPDVQVPAGSARPLASQEALRIGVSYGLVPPGTASLSPEQQANVQAFAAELQAYEGSLRGQVFGPGMEALATNDQERQQIRSSVRQIQQALNQLIAAGQLRVTGPNGAPVQQIPTSGSYFQLDAQGREVRDAQGAPVMDPAFVAAITTFKQQAGLHQTYKLADGSFGINEYVGPGTVAALRDALARIQR